MPKTVLMLATYGLEIVEVGGTLALHAQAGDAVHAAVVLSRPQTRPQVEQAANILRVGSVRFLDFQAGETQLDIPSKIKLVQLIREIRPDTLITQDPEHSFADLDPDRRLLMLLYLEAASLAGRDWRIEDCGGFAPHLIRDLYYMSPENPNCVVEIGSTFALKQQALQVLEGQLTFTAQVLRKRLDPESLEAIVPGYGGLSDLDLGRSLHREMDKSLALYHGLLSHAGATMAEAFRHQFPFRLSKLL